MAPPPPGRYTDGSSRNREGGGNMALLEVRQLQKVYTTRFGGNAVRALDAGYFVTIVVKEG